MHSHFYVILGVEASATFDAIKKAYRKLALLHHPDRGGSADKFKDVNTAYETLSDPQKRQMYDAYGEKGPPPPQQRMPDIFNVFFQQSRTRGADIVHPLLMSLEEIFTGKLFRLNIHRDVLCKICPHSGAECPGCQGKGLQYFIQPMGTVMQRVAMDCSMCKGSGKQRTVNACTSCLGTGVVKEDKVLSVQVPPGCPENHRFVFEGQSDASKELPPGDVVFVVTVNPHTHFKRSGQFDLVCEKTINITEALCGFTFNMQGIDKTTVTVKSSGVTEPGMKLVRQHGLPTPTGMRGNLVIMMRVQFPESLENIEDLRKLLPAAPATVETTSGNSVEFEAVQSEQQNTQCAQM